MPASMAFFIVFINFVSLQAHENIFFHHLSFLFLGWPGPGEEDCFG
jgi:hypothetical protein